MKNEEILLENIKDVKKMLWEDRKFLISMMIKMDKLVKFVSDMTIIEDTMFGDDRGQFDEEKVLRSIMEDLKDDIEDKREDFIKYHKMINSDQVGES
jgi:hypothetical protein|tara:strand:- start:34 stop:324 length:291 start_codon:yes stop_codon:yes gene_type:complete